MLAAGIDVFSTVNVQHLESPQRQGHGAERRRVRETVPDAVLAADEVVLVDLTPEALLDRLRAGKVYPAERIDAALNNFFRVENLGALRELALRQVADELGAKRATTELVGSREESLAADASAGRRRAAARAGGALSGCPAAGAPGVALGAASGGRARPAVGPSSGEAAVDEDRSARLPRCASSRRCSARDARRGIRRPHERGRGGRARRGTTYILMGRARPARGLARLRRRCPSYSWSGSPGSTCGSWPIARGERTAQA